MKVDRRHPRCTPGGRGGGGIAGDGMTERPEYIKVDGCHESHDAHGEGSVAVRSYTRVQMRDSRATGEQTEEIEQRDSISFDR